MTRSATPLGFFATLIAASSLCGCGLKGPLYLPNERASTPQVATDRQVNPTRTSDPKSTTDATPPTRLDPQSAPAKDQASDAPPAGKSVPVPPKN